MDIAADQDTRDSSFDNIRVCERCGIRYDWRNSPSGSLKMTYCGSLCEHAALGFTIEAALKNERQERTALELPGLDPDLELDPARPGSPD